MLQSDRACYCFIKISVGLPQLRRHHVGVEQPPSSKEADRTAAEARDLERTGAQAKAFETGLPSARVVRLPHANHYVFRSNEADVLREMNAFIGSLPK